MEVTSTSYARIADRYEQARGGAERADLLAGAVIPWLPTSGTVLDVGAGTCVVAERLQTPDRAVIGVDLSREMLGQAGPRLPGQKAQADAMTLPFLDHTVDAVTFVWDLPEDDWSAHVDPALAELRSLPDPDRVRMREYRNPIWVLERP